MLGTPMTLDAMIGKVDVQFEYVVDDSKKK